jgi:hypothetical protein
MRRRDGEGRARGDRERRRRHLALRDFTAAEIREPLNSCKNSWPHRSRSLVLVARSAAINGREGAGGCRLVPSKRLSEREARRISVPSPLCATVIALSTHGICHTHFLLAACSSTIYRHFSQYQHQLHSFFLPPPVAAAALLHLSRHSTRVHFRCIHPVACRRHRPARSLRARQSDTQRARSHRLCEDLYQRRLAHTYTAARRTH